jgi:glycosyltransferase involved in cell wall biosynthesis
LNENEKVAQESIGGFLGGLEFMRIVQVSVGSARMPPTEGSAPLQVIFNLSKHLASMGHQVTILDSRYSREDPDSEFYDGLEIARLNSCKIPGSMSTSLPRYIRFALNELNTILFSLKVSRYLARNGKNIDVIHLHLTSVGLTISVLNSRLREKMVYTSHLGQWVLRGTNKLTLLERVHVFLDSYLMRRVARVIALNDAAKDSFKSIGKVSPENIAVVHNGVDTEFFNPSLDAEDTRRKYDLCGKSVVLFVGQLSRIKGTEYFIKAANIIVNQFGYGNEIFLLVGPLTFGTLEKPIDLHETLRYVKEQHLEANVLFMGYLSLNEVRILYVASDIFVLPSLAEGDPLVVVEAMASGKPVIGTKVGGIPHHIRDGWNGFLVDPANEQQLADKIKYLIDNPDERKRMGANSRKYAVEEFDWSKVAERLLAVYQMD